MSYRNITSIGEAITEAQKKWGIELKESRNHKEAHGICPLCGNQPGGAHKDGFMIFENGGYYCRKCERKGWIIDGKGEPLTQSEINAIQIAQMRRKQAEIETRLTALERMATMMPVADRYHQQLTNEDRWHWADQGIFTEAQDKYKLGVCHHCPLKPDTPSYTLPVINGGNLRNIRHRLQVDDGDRYRPHIVGLPQTLFGADNLKTSGEVGIVEGGKKHVVLSQYDEIPATVGVMGCSGFKESWARHFVHFKIVYVMYDPDVPGKAQKLAGLFGSRGRVVKFPVKPDDFFSQYDGTPAQFMEYVRLAR